MFGILQKFWLTLIFCICATAGLAGPSAYSFSGPKDGLSVTWFGAASVLIDDGTAAVLIDPFVSRKENSIGRILLGKPAVVKKAAIEARGKLPEYQRVEAIFVGHSHYDHSLDAAYFAKPRNIPVYGSDYTRRIVQAHGYSGGQIIEHGTTIAGRFKVTAYESRHGRPPLGINLFDDTLSTAFDAQSALRDYAMGEVFAFLIEHPKGNVLHIGSAGVKPDYIKSISADVDLLLLSLVGRPPTVDYLKNTVGLVDPGYVIPIHYDNLFKPLDKPVKISGIAKLNNFFDTMGAEYPDTKTGVLEFDKAWRLAPVE